MPAALFPLPLKAALAEALELAGVKDELMKLDVVLLLKLEEKQ